MSCQLTLGHQLRMKIENVFLRCCLTRPSKQAIRTKSGMVFSWVGVQGYAVDEANAYECSMMAHWNHRIRPKQGCQTCDSDRVISTGEVQSVDLRGKKERRVASSK